MLQVIADEWIDYSQTATINEIVNISDTTQFAKVLWQHILQGESQ
ncbi:CoA biosynthesis protein CoaBC OS=Lysinibacillus sphaericus OX=1421 GN=LS41612_18110 PE=4 SV=1 [Lysinibacillus sphaericus]